MQQQQDIQPGDRVRGLAGDHCSDLGTVIRVEWDEQGQAHYATVRWDTGVRWEAIPDYWQHILNGSQIKLVDRPSSLPVNGEQIVHIGE